MYGLDWPRPGLTVKITYREPACPGDAKDVSLPVQFAAPRIIESPPPELPDGVTAGAEPVTLQVVLDHEGAVRRAMAIGGPAALTAPAIAAMTTWRAEPARVNGAPIAVPFVVQAAFKPTTPK